MAGFTDPDLACHLGDNRLQSVKPVHINEYFLAFCETEPILSAQCVSEQPLA